MDFDDDHQKNRYNINSKIMVTAIMCLSFVVLLVTLLHIYVRCVLRRQVRRRRGTLRQLGLDATAHESPKTGLNPTVIASLPVFTFKEDGVASAIECAVCLSTLEDSELIRILPNCKHNFHADCIDKWLSTNSTCPICRTEAEPRVVLEPGEATAVGVQPTAPPIDPEGTSDGSIQASAKVTTGSSSSSSSLRLSSFRKMLSRERSSQRIQSRSPEEAGLEDLERQ